MAVDDVQEIEALAELGIAAGGQGKAANHLLQQAPPSGTLNESVRSTGQASWHSGISTTSDEGSRNEAVTCCEVLSTLAAAVVSPLPCFAADVKKAKEGGFHTVQSLIMNPRKVGVLLRVAWASACIAAEHLLSQLLDSSCLEGGSMYWLLLLQQGSGHQHAPSSVLHVPPWLS